MGQGGSKVGTRSRMSERLGGVGYMGGPYCYQAMSKLIIVKSMVRVILRHIISSAETCSCTLCRKYFIFYQ